MFSRLFSHQVKRRVPDFCYRPRIEALEERLLLATETWTGAGGTINWSNPANWDTGHAPSAGDDLSLGSSSTNNDLPPGMVFHSITIDNGTIQGNAIVLTGGIVANQPGGIITKIPITLAADQSFTGVLIMYGAFDLNGFTLTVDNTNFAGPFTANGTVIGGAIFFASTMTLSS